MVRVLHLVENGSYRFDHRARREVCSLRDAGGKVHVVCPDYKGESLRETMDERVEEVLSWPHLLRIHENLYPGQITWSEAACASA